MKSLHVLALSSLLCTGLALAQTTPSTTTKPAAKTAAPKTTAAPSAADIASAKAKGLVWANKSTKVYHMSSDKEYGTTKNGAFMTEAAAQAAGFKTAAMPASKSTAKPATAAAPAKPAMTPAPAMSSASASKPASTPAPAPAAGSSSSAKTAAPKASAAPPPDSAAIAAAKASGQVWVNKNTKVYHKSADKEYGTTKNGAFMTEAAAQAAGYKLAKN